MLKDKISPLDKEKLSKRFTKKVDSTENNTECHIWLASKNKTGHGMFSVMGKTIPSSRFAFMMYNGDVADHQVVTQTCFNPSCVNPKHLEISDKRRIGKRITVHPDQLVTGSIQFLKKLKKERPDLEVKIDDLINQINNPPSKPDEVNFGDIDPFSNTFS